MKLDKEVECIIRAILYPKSQICLLCDKTNIEKCSDDFRLLSDQHKIIQEEIKTMENEEIVFKNGSSIKIIPPSKPEDVVRGKRATIRPCMFDWEYQIDNEILDEVLKPFLTEGRSN